MVRFLGALLLLLSSACLGLPAPAQGLPEGDGRPELEKICKGCHEMARSISKRQDRDAWLQTMNRMSAFGMKSTETEFARTLDYLARHYPAGDVPPVNVNKATAIELESGLTLRRSQAAALLRYRAENGPFKSLDDLKKVPQLDPAHLDAKKDRIAF